MYSNARNCGTEIASGRPSRILARMARMRSGTVSRTAAAASPAGEAATVDEVTVSC
jgi:hypothetical protein